MEVFRGYFGLSEWCFLVVVGLSWDFRGNFVGQFYTEKQRFISFFGTFVGLSWEFRGNFSVFFGWV